MDFDPILTQAMPFSELLLAGVTGIALFAGGVALRSRAAYRRASDLLRRKSELVANLEEGVFRTTLDGSPISANPALVRLNGYATEAEHHACIKDIATEWYVDPSRRRQFLDAMERDGRVEDFVSEVYRHRTRERIWVSESARVVRDSAGKPLYYEGTVRDVTETVRRLQLEERFSKLMCLTPVGLFQIEVVSDGPKWRYVNECWERITGISRDEVVAGSRIPRHYIHPDDLGRYLKSLANSARDLSAWVCEFRYAPPQGPERWLKISAEAEVCEDGIVYHGYLEDTSDRHQHELEIEKLAFFDKLTALPNRRLLLTRMAQAIEERASLHDFGALLFIDLDNFKALNDTHGHEIGDAFLKEIAARLSLGLRSQDTIARIGGDEFVVILNGLGNGHLYAADAASLAAEKALASIGTGIAIGGMHLHASACVGVVVFDGSELTSDELMKRADMAMYRAKGSGHNAIGVFDPDDIDQHAARYQLAGEFSEAIAKDQLELFVQPQIDAGGIVSAAEALVRWRHPQHGLVFPDLFLSIADQFGLTAEMERVILTKGIMLLNTWSKSPRTANMRLSLNVGVQTISSDGFAPWVKALIAKYEIDPLLLCFEVTEHVMVKDQASILRCMNELKQMGVRLALDDFGTGYSSLAYLKQLPFDEIKIDGRFVRDIEHSESDRALVRAIVSMAKALNMETVAEHVETTAQEGFLRSLGCDLFQGHLYSPAVPADRFPAFAGDYQDKQSQVPHHAVLPTHSFGTQEKKRAGSAVSA